MRNLLLTALIITTFTTTTFLSCATVNGVDMRNASKSDITTLMGGAALSFGVHTLSHAIYLESINADWSIQGFNEVIDDREMPDHEIGWSGRSGQVGQLILGSIFNYGPWSDKFKNSYLVKGYNIATFFQVASNTIFYTGDSEFIERSGADLGRERLLYMTIGAVPVIRDILK